MRAGLRCRVFIGAALTILSGVSASLAQERAPNPGKQAVLRAWPMSGAWGVILIRLIDGRLGCLLATGHQDQRSGETYNWGVRWRHEGLGASITDNNAQAVAGSSIQIIIDKVAIGTYQVSKRLSANGFHSVVAEFPAAESDRILSLIGVGGEMQFVTNTFTYSAPLQGSQQALANLKVCTIEASHLDAAQSQ